ncbi:hypothetical protein [Methylobacterium sp. Leaf118]|uniref:hypothetical protein n=1 Tax=Methylobacterium sp. Leaf118 TaxID=2876562 RepID=UPI001E5C3562|nr:hypothetical protein [Methylobacterium sp. Leaf118]
MTGHGSSAAVDWTPTGRHHAFCARASRIAVRIAPHFRTALDSGLAMTEMAQTCPATILGLIAREKAIENPSHERERP